MQIQNTNFFTNEKKLYKFTNVKNRQIQYKQIYKWKKIGKYNTNKFTNEKNRQIQYKQIYKCKKIGK